MLKLRSDFKGFRGKVYWFENRKILDFLIFIFKDGSEANTYKGLNISILIYSNIAVNYSNCQFFMFLIKYTFPPKFLELIFNLNITYYIICKYC